MYIIKILLHSCHLFKNLYCTLWNSHYSFSAPKCVIFRPCSDKFTVLYRSFKDDWIVTNLLPLSVTVKDLRKSVNIWRSMRQECSGTIWLTVDSYTGANHWTCSTTRISLVTKPYAVRIKQRQCLRCSRRPSAIIQTWLLTDSQAVSTQWRWRSVSPSHEYPTTHSTLASVLSYIHRVTVT